MQEIPDGYTIPTEFTVWTAAIGEQDVIVFDITVVVPNHDMEPQRAILVLTPEDAAKVALDINNAVQTAGEEQ